MDAQYQMLLSEFLKLLQLIGENVKIILKLLERYDQSLPIMIRDLETINTSIDSVASDIDALVKDKNLISKVDSIHASLTTLMNLANMQSKMYNRTYSDDEIATLGQYVIWIRDIHNFVCYLKILISKIKNIMYFLGLIFSAISYIWFNFEYISKALLKLIK